jgi:hypothetical protein
MPDAKNQTIPYGIANIHEKSEIANWFCGKRIKIPEDFVRDSKGSGILTVRLRYINLATLSYTN